MAIQKQLNTGNVPQVCALPGSMFGAQQIVLTFAAVPASGTVSIEVMPVGKTQWVPLAKATLLPVANAPYFIRSAGWISAARVTFASVVGGAGALLWVEQIQLPDGLFEGLAAITTQGYIETNVKRGLQYEISSNVPALLATANIDTIFITGNAPVIIKGRQVKFNGASLLTRVYRLPVYTGGSPVPYFNLNDINPIVGNVIVLAGATISDPGIEFGAPTYDIGSDGIGSSSISTYAVSGVERVLAPNTAYLQRITNDSGATQRVSGYLTWHDGGTDLPL